MSVLSTWIVEYACTHICTLYHMHIFFEDLMVNELSGLPRRLNNIHLYQLQRGSCSNPQIHWQALVPQAALRSSITCIYSACACLSCKLCSVESGDFVPSSCVLCVGPTMPPWARGGSPEEFPLASLWWEQCLLHWEVFSLEA